MKKIKWGVIGTAGIARSCTIPGMIQAYNCELYAIAGRSIDKAEQFKEKFGFEKAYGSYKEIIYVFLTIFLYLLKCPQSLIL